MSIDFLEMDSQLWKHKAIKFFFDISQFVELFLLIILVKKNSSFVKKWRYYGQNTEKNQVTQAISRVSIFWLLLRHLLVKSGIFFTKMISKKSSTNYDVW
jgi:hypothetical protein